MKLHQGKAIEDFWDETPLQKRAIAGQNGVKSFNLSIFCYWEGVRVLDLSGLLKEGDFLKTVIDVFWKVHEPSINCGPMTFSAILVALLLN